MIVRSILTINLINMRENTSELSPEARAHYEPKAREILRQVKDSGSPFIGKSDVKGSKTGIRGYDDIHKPAEGEPMIPVNDEEAAIELIIKTLVQRETSGQDAGGTEK